MAGGRRLPPSMERLWLGELRRAHAIINIISTEFRLLALRERPWRSKDILGCCVFCLEGDSLRHRSGAARPAHKHRINTWTPGHAGGRRRRVTVGR
jgi:hypothetical protein